MKKTLFLYSGEGTKYGDSSSKLLRFSPRWTEIEHILKTRLDLDLEQVWDEGIDNHRCPYSPLITVVAQICLSDHWRRWGYEPDLFVGHSIGELTAAYEAGLYSLEEILLLTYQIGKATANLNGVMLHGKLSDEQIAALPVNLSSYNFIDGDLKHVTLSGYEEEMGEFLNGRPDFVRMKLPHPWHHPDYRDFTGEIEGIASASIEQRAFVSGRTADFETRLPADHWKNWLVRPVDFIRSMQAIKEEVEGLHLDVIEIGFHPVLDKCCEVFDDYRYASSMFRGEDEIKWIAHQRNQLDPSVFKQRLFEAVEGYKPGIDFKTSLAYQGFTSLAFVEFTAFLQPYFPALKPQDFYRYKTVNQLIDHFGIEKPLELAAVPKGEKGRVVIAGMSCKLPASVENAAQFWRSLLSREDQVKANPNRGGFEAGFLADRIARFDHRYFNISKTEAQTMDPQQILALELTEMLFKDAGIDPEQFDKNRVGVYIGVWNQEYTGHRDSVYYPTGTNPSIIASRISYQYDFRGPSWVSNTACSSSLVAVHYAAKDIEEGRVDVAIAGGVNMILGNDFTGRMRNSGFLSKDDRCKAFDDSANGYVRAEGGGLVLLTRKSLSPVYYAELLGSSINQNGARSQLITAPSPEAQEDLILQACRDAGISPGDIAYVESHGTGTKIGDPIEFSALQNTVARDRKDPCYVGSVKSNLGHLESAAGIAGLIKSALMLNKGVIPPNLHFNRPNAYIDFEAAPLKVASEETGIDPQALVGISSFGFGGVNAHVVIKGAEEEVRKPVEDIPIPFDRDRSAPLTDYFRLDSAPAALPAEEWVENLEGVDAEKVVRELFSEITNIGEIDPDVELFEQGLDSMSATEFITSLEREFNIELDEEFLLDFPLIDQIVGEIRSRTAGAGPGDEDAGEPAHGSSEEFVREALEN